MNGPKPEDSNFEPTRFQGDDSLSEIVCQYCDRFERAWRTETPLSIEQLLAEANPDSRARLLRELLTLETQLRRQAGDEPTADDYATRFPGSEGLIDDVLSQVDDRTLPPDSADMKMGMGRENAPAAAPRRLGDYELFERLGRGGMGEVFRARQVRLDQEVAIKVLPHRFLANAQAISRFEREMRAAGQLRHPNIVQALNAGEDEGVYFIVMEFVSGETLQDILRRVGPLPVADACEIIRQSAVGLQHAHEHGLVHRDIKPGNIMLDRSGLVKLLDMGLSRHQSDETHADLTRAGEIMGTVDYMAPEQWEDAASVDIRADIYSLGCTLYTILAGRPPFSGERYRSPIAKGIAHSRTAPDQITSIRGDIPDALVEVLDRMMAKKADDRYPTPQEVAQQLTPFARASSPTSLLSEVDDAASATRGISSDAPHTQMFQSPDLDAVNVSTLGGPVHTMAPSPAREPHEDRRPAAVQTQSDAAEPPKKGRRRLMIGGAFIFFAILAAVIVIRITDKEGNTTTVKVPSGSDVTVNQDNSVDVTLPDEPTDPADPTDPTTEPVDPTAEPTVEPANPTTEPTEPATEPVEPPTEPIEPPTEPADPTTESEDPTIEPVDPVTEPVEPTTEPVEPTTDPVTPAEPIAKRTIVLPQWPGRPCDARFSPGGTLLATKDSAAFIDLRDQLSGALLHRIAGRFTTLDATAFSADDAKFYVGTEKGTIHVYDSRTGGQIGTFDWHDEPVARLLLSPGEKYLLSAAADGEVVIWDLVSGERHDQFAAAKDHLTAIKFDNDGPMLLYLTGEGKFQIRDVQSREVMFTAPMTVDRFSKVVVADFSTKTPRLLTVVANRGDSTVVKLWDTKSGEEKLSRVTARQGKTIARLSDDGAKLILFLDKDESLPKDLLATGNVIQTQADLAMFSPDNMKLVTASAVADDSLGKSYQIMLSDIDTDEPIWTAGVDQQCLDLRMSPDGSSVLVATCGGATLLDATDGQQLGAIESGIVDAQSLKFGPDLRRIILGANVDIDQAFANPQPTIYYDLKSDKPIRTLGQSCAISRCELSPDGKFALIGGTSGGVNVWDLQTARRPVLCEKDATDISVMAFSKDGKQLLIGGAGLAALWDVEKWEKICDFQLPESSCTTAAVFNSDGTQIVIGASDQTATLWDIATVQRLQTFDLDAAANEAVHDATLKHAAQRIAFTPDQSRIAVQVDRGILVFDPSSGGSVWSQFGAAVDLSPDAGRAVIGSDNKLTAVRLTNPDGELTRVNRVSVSGQTRTVMELRPIMQIRTLFEPYAIRSVRISSNGTRMISYGDAGIARIWDIESGERLHELKNVEDFALGQSGIQLGVRFPVRFGSKVLLWDARQGDVVSTILCPDNPFDERTSVAFSADAKRMLVGYDSGYTQLFDKDGLTATFYADIDGSRWIAVSPSCDYECAEEAADLVGYRDAENHFLLGSEVSDTYHQPDKVIARIAGEEGSDESGE